MHSTLKEKVAVYRKSGYNIVIIDFARHSTKHAILKKFAVTLKFPDYFGYNLDALDECIRDLSWLSTKNTLVVFKNVSIAKDKELARKLVWSTKENAKDVNAEGFDFIVLTDG